MPLILISGYPSSGKTYRSRQLLDFFNSKISSSPDPRIQRLSVCHVNDQSLGLQRSVYGESRTEKDARAAEYSTVKRALGRETIVIADGLNYIKGFRYQLYCEAKALQTPSCVIHVGTPVEECKQINTRLLEDPGVDGGYPQDVFNDLVYRYEEPNGMTRWDSPLFTVPYEDEKPPFEDIWDAMIGSEGKPKLVKPNQATVMKPAADQDYLYELGRITQEVLQIILDWQKDHQGEGGAELPLGDASIIQLPPNPVSLPQLQRIRRQFIQLNRQHELAKSGIRASFADYLDKSLS
ncbi:hypothetical protein MMC31_000147 [Peltigera leucophlebia]|nr:hypothetical protein [Peltigera leucophlebia]